MYFYAILLALGIVLITIILKVYSRKNKSYWIDKNIPFVSTTDIMTIIKILTKSKTVIGLDQENYDQLKGHRFGGVTEFGKPALLITDLDLIKRIMIKDFDHFVDRQIKKYEHEPLFGKMLVSLHGQEWKDVRSQLTPTFTSGKIRRMFQHFNKCGDNLVSYLKSQPDNVITQDIVSRFVVDVIGATAFGFEANALNEKDSIFLKMVKEFSDLSTMRILKSLLYLNFPKVANFFKLEMASKKSMDFLTSILSQALKDRERDTVSNLGNRRDDFLQIMVEARKTPNKVDGSASDNEETSESKESGSKGTLSDQIVMAQSLMFFLAGMDTTTGLLTFALYLMAVHQDIQEKVYQEVGKICDSDLDKANEGDSNGVQYETVTQMEYLDMFISEIQRQYPIASRIKRLCTEDYPIPDSDFVIPKGMTVTIPVQGIHHDAMYYPNPHEFNPERFLAKNTANRHQCAYLPFGHGPRNCIGMRFALIETKVAIVHIVRNFVIRPTDKTPIPIKIDAKLGTNRPVANLELCFTPRH